MGLNDRKFDFPGVWGYQLSVGLVHMPELSQWVKLMPEATAKVGRDAAPEEPE